MKVDIPHFGTKREGHEGPRHGNEAGLLAQAGHGAIWGSALKHDPLIMSSSQAMGSRPLGAVFVPMDLPGPMKMLMFRPTHNSAVRSCCIFYIFIVVMSYNGLPR